MGKYTVKSNVTVGTTKDGNTTFKDYKAGDSVELTEEQALEINYALEDGPVDENVPESTRMRPDHKDSGVAAAHKVDLPADQVAASEAKARQNVLDSPSAEFSDGSPLAEDLSSGSTDNLTRKSAPKRVAGGGPRTDAPSTSPTTSTAKSEEAKSK